MPLEIDSDYVTQVLMLRTMSNLSERRTAFRCKCRIETRIFRAQREAIFPDLYVVFKPMIFKSLMFSIVLRMAYDVAFSND